MRFLPLALTAAALGLAYLTDLPRDFGAHPWWSQKVVLMGGGVALLLTALFTFWNKATLLRTVLFGALAVVAYLVADYGKTQFAASYAEDAVAGQMWYFGWLTLSAFAGLALGSALQLLFKRA
jgi:hypothetical protein